ncbi:MAG TPA: protein adenylyltransferase SelO family protein, partial [Pseudomonadales bacterium]
GQLLQLLAAERRDYHDFFRRLGNVAAAELATLDDSFVDRERWRSWRTGYRQRLAMEDRDDSQRQAAMHAVNPKFVLRNYLAQLAIEKAENGDDSLVNTLLAVLQQPFAEHPAQQALAAPPPDWGKQLEISCSS